MAKVSIWRNGSGEGFPNGTTISDYKNWEEWSYRRWAWEFLRRNPYFIIDCKKVKSGEIKEEEVCARFSLQEFKHYEENYRSENSKLPIFPLNRRRFAANVSCDGINKRNKAKVKLKPGEVVFVFDLNQEIQVAGSLDAQINIVTNRLHQLKDAYLLSNNHVSPKELKPQKGSFIKALRLLDAIREHKSHTDGYKAAFPTMCKNLSIDEIRKKAESDLRTASAYALTGYLQIAAKKRDPSK